MRLDLKDSLLLWMKGMRGSAGDYLADNSTVIIETVEDVLASTDNMALPEVRVPNWSGVEQWL